MSQLEPAATIERTVGARRHATAHLGRAVSSEQRVYILHSEACLATGIDLRLCPYSIALDLGIDLDVWDGREDTVVRLAISNVYGDLKPAALIENNVPQRACSKCGCTDDDCSQCIARTGQPCSWARPDLCTACTT